ncbi:hypothetical protein OH77DRAFT_1432313 [Trametes cingulata]|nr:hypothetical protein OH77DRAFT_1432313 [Trametes cingulata]
MTTTTAARGCTCTTAPALAPGRASDTGTPPAATAMTAITAPDGHRGGGTPLRLGGVVTTTTPPVIPGGTATRCYAPCSNSKSEPPDLNSDVRTQDLPRTCTPISVFCTPYSGLNSGPSNVSDHAISFMFVLNN